MDEEKVIVASGYFDPLHIGHVEYLQQAKALGHKLIVIVNNDKQAHLKKGFEFMPFEERLKIVEALGCVDEVFPSIDQDGSVVESLRALARERKVHVFAKGGDRFAHEIPEGPVLREHGIEIIHGLGDKIQSSSDLVAKQKNQVK